jgi:hypothetical protein
MQPSISEFLFRLIILDVDLKLPAYDLLYSFPLSRDHLEASVLTARSFLLLYSIFLMITIILFGLLGQSQPAPRRM